MSRLHVVHRTRFSYAAPVAASYNEARMRPLDLPRQIVLDSHVTVERATWTTEYRDYWGTLVTAFEVLEPHTQLSVIAESRVEVAAARTQLPGCGWDTLAEPSFADHYAEFLGTSPATEPDPTLEELSRTASAGADPLEAARAVCEAVRGEVRYLQGVTGTHTRAVEAWAERAGVCQDIAHLTLGALRTLGIPARYVSGYLHPATGSTPGLAVRGQSHAWIEWWTGEWHGFDPTNGVDAGEHHVVVARGREYGDVAPLRGVFAGGAPGELDVEVAITEEA